MFLFDYLAYLIKSKSRSSIENPFMYRLCAEILNERDESGHTEPIEVLRKSLEQNHRKIVVKDLGAGSKKDNSREKKISGIVKNAAKSKKYAGLLYRLVKWQQPSTMLELGTSLGISTAYQSFAAPNAKFISLEGCPQTASEAKRNLETLGCNVEIRIGNFDETLQGSLQTLQKLDWLFIDGNHRKKATVDYFEQCLPYLHENSIVVIDDINWSGEMQSAWRTIKSNSMVVSSLDLFFPGILFFHAGMNKKHFVIRY